MEDLTSVVEQAVSEATDAGVFGDSDAGDTMPDATTDPAPDATTETPDATADSTEATPAATEPAATENVAPETKPETKPTTPTAKSEADELAEIKTELLGKTPGLAKGRIPVIEHQAVLTRARRKHEAEVAALNTKIEGYKPYDSQDVKEQIAAIRLAENNPDVFFNKVLMNDPRYKALVDARVAEAAKTVAPAATTPAAEAAKPEMPKPDVLNADGTLGYSAEALQKALEFSLAKERDAQAAEMKKLREELAPVTQRAEMETRLTAAMDRQGQVLSNARKNWRGFTDHEPAIRAELAKPGNESIDLFQAYSNVVVGHYETASKVTETERAKIVREAREAVVKELNGAPRTKSVRPGQLPAASAGDADMSTEDVVRAAMRAANMTQ
jgi:hypothetical protein